MLIGTLFTTENWSNTSFRFNFEFSGQAIISQSFFPILNSHVLNYEYFFYLIRTSALQFSNTYIFYSAATANIILLFTTDRRHYSICTRTAVAQCIWFSSLKFHFNSALDVFNYWLLIIIYYFWVPTHITNTRLFVIH